MAQAFLFAVSRRGLARTKTSSVATNSWLILSRLVERGPAELNVIDFDSQQNKDTKQGMLLVGLAGAVCRLHHV